MEASPNQNTEPMDRVAKIWHFMLDHILGAPDRQSNHYRGQVDVGKSAAQAANVQLVIEGIEQAPEQS